MASLAELAQQITDLIDSAVEKFNSGIPALEQQVYSDMSRLIKDLDLKGDSLANTAKNIRSIGELKGRIERIILNPDYIDHVREFAQAFSTVSKLQNAYFNELSAQFGPSDLLDAIRANAIDLSVTSLTEAGISSNVTEGIQDILQRNITGGANYSDLLEQMRNFITSNDSGAGALARYTKQITTDSLNQFSAQYTQAVTEDLGMKWFMYVGSNLKTTRQFCLLMTKKKYIHVSELPQIIRGVIDGVQIPISERTGTWSGGIPGTNANNLQVNRGGYGCGHQMMPVPEEMVPLDVRSRIAA